MSKQAIEAIGRSAPAEPAPRTLLVVVDHQEVRELVQALLADTEWIVDCVEKGEDALARLEVCAYDLILTDVLMPGMDGLTLLRRVRERHPGAHIVVMTVKNTPEHILGSLRREAASYMNKPLFRDTLITTLETALSTQLNPGDIKIFSDRPHWISLQVACRLATANRLAEFMRELLANLNPKEREQIAAAFRELLLNAVEHGGHLDPEQTVDLSYIRTAGRIFSYIRDSGEGFSVDNLEHSAIANTSGSFALSPKLANITIPPTKIAMTTNG
jgi:CheY-like chemotaxis protein/anti-sigma regulatory factor (Ser/Thr protein kinase)